MTLVKNTDFIVVFKDNELVREVDNVSNKHSKNIFILELNDKFIPQPNIFTKVRFSFCNNESDEFITFVRILAIKNNATAKEIYISVMKYIHYVW